MLETLRGSKAFKYKVYCETEKKSIIVVTTKERAMYFSYKHAQKNHDVSIIGPNGSKERYQNTAWVYRCERCGKEFQNNMAWVNHMASRECFQTQPAGDKQKQG
ncbi:MAG: hypothetical protein QXG05_01070 [Nitrososphaerota archaeon]